ncbi:hypothetical protein GCM10018980_49580 [Streptomyces capoamus]|uniref:Integral membrane protein n=1 Tax=Streptomyces capoamus TaxID=68183 RepID=A0A919EZ34_9ACTN|nr:hypothetical protein [Streptomyces capoamus]GGW10911.1 hypothetical protein GCM10010501_07110 [Streptomyces libani subsp. rufus]GHG60838.1 hypothetical protein GCM10018980_49580 [Streptomyces capoamus]
MTSGGVRIDGNTLRLPGGVAVRFVRTLRLPESGTHPLPPGLGEFPVRRVADYADRVPEPMRARGGVMLPVYLREAMWLSFAGTTEPAALQVGVGKVCAVSGEPWRGRLSRRPQNYVVLPRQPWLDGINSGRGTVRQFVAVPLGLGATVEGQVTGEEVWGGVQLQAFALTQDALAKWRHQERERERALPPVPPGVFGATGSYGPPGVFGAALPMGAPAPGGPPPGGAAGSPPPAAAYGAPPPPAAAPPRAAAMGLGVGGSMRQEVYRDDRPLGDWSDEPAGRVFVHLVTPPEWRRITGEAPPPSPVDRAAYTRAGLPWYDYYDADAEDLAPSDTLGGVEPVGEWLGADLDPWQAPDAGQVAPLKDAPGKPVEDGEW